MKKRILVIPDVHGRNTWKAMIEKSDATEYIFLGDYFDTRDGISPEKQLSNFRDIIDFKDRNPNSTILLIGNHDYHYMDGVKETYSGYNPILKENASFLFRENFNKLKMCHQDGDFLFSHAGISNAWLVKSGWDGEPIADFVNDMWYHFPHAFKHNGIDPYGDDVESSPIWIRPRSLMAANKYTMPEYFQVVGHTYRDTVTIIDNYYFTDCMDSGDFLTIDFGEKETTATILSI